MKNIGEGICRIADEEGADLIVVGTQGTGGIRFSTKGSVCEYVMRNSPIPTVIIPSRKSHHFWAWCAAYLTENETHDVERSFTFVVQPQALCLLKQKL